MRVKTIGGALSMAAFLYPEKEAIVFASRRLTYKNLHEKSCRLANLLINQGAKPGIKIGIRLPRSPEYVVSYFAISMMGSVIVPLNPDLTAREILTILKYCDVQLLITDVKGLRLIKEVQDHCPNLTSIVIFDSDDDATTSPQQASVKKMCPEVLFCSPLLEYIPSTSPQVSIDPGQLALLLHTSGTTNRPKRVMLSHRNVLINARSHTASLELSHEDIVLIALPMFFGYCNTAQMITHILLGGTLVLLPGLFTPSQFCRLVENERITTFTGVPTMLLYLLDYGHLLSYDLSSLRYVFFGGSLMPHDKLMELKQKLPSVAFVQTYGLTEAAPRVTTLLFDEMLRKPNSVGRAIPGVKLSIVNENGFHQPPFEIGEIVVRGENVMLGYYKRSDVTDKTIKSGYLFTGDIGYLDDEGYLYLVGRKKNVIIRGGINIYPEEIEEYLMEHPAVLEAVVISEKHRLQGDVPVGIVVLREGYEESEKTLIAYCKKGLTSHKIPVRIEFRCELPKTYNKKVQRYKF